MEKGCLLLETGDCFEGELFGRIGEGIGEVVFNTSMTGYQEIITDPSYAGQIVVFCYPLIGNYGVNALDRESRRPYLSGIVVGEWCESPSHYRSEHSLARELEEAGIVGLSGVDTRALVKLVRARGTLKGVILPASMVSGKYSREFWEDECLWKSDSPRWVEMVSTKEVLTYPNDGPHIVLIDYGSKKSILTALLQEGCKVTIVPYDCTYEQIRELKPDGIFMSNGPGDPMALKELFPEIKRITEAYPTFGICLGHQLIALAHGAKTEKLRFGHRGSNHPVKEMETGKVWITSQNHGYVVVEESLDRRIFQVTYRNINDGTVEGIRHRHLPIQSVQFHPEAHAGPLDTVHLIHRFVEQLRTGEYRYAITQ